MQLFSLNVKTSSSSHNVSVYTVVISLLSFGINAQANAANLDLTQWTSFGDVDIVSSEQVNLSTDALSEDDFDLGVPNGTFNVSGNPAGPVGFGFPLLEDFLGVDASTLDRGGFAIEGSAIKTTINASAGDVLEFKYNFSTNETSALLDPSVGFLNDYGFLLIDQQVIPLATINDATLVSTEFDSETGIESDSFPFLETKPYTVAFGVVDQEDFITTSGLNISNVTLTSVLPAPDPPSSIPEPGTLPGLIIPGLWGLSCLLKQKK